MSDSDSDPAPAAGLAPTEATPHALDEPGLKELLGLVAAATQTDFDR